MTILLENIGILTDLLTLGAPILLGLSAAAYLSLLLSWKQASNATEWTTSSSSS